MWLRILVAPETANQEDFRIRYATPLKFCWAKTEILPNLNITWTKPLHFKVTSMLCTLRIQKFVQQTYYFKDCDELSGVFFSIKDLTGKWRLISTLSPAFIACRLLDRSHSDWREMVPHTGFDLHFSDNEWCWASFHVFVSHLYVFFGEMSI